MHAAQTINLSQLLAQTARLHPDRAGLIQADRTWTWREIDQRVDAMVSALRARGLAVSRLARGVPIGGELEYVDAATVAQAMRDRRKV